jgi:glycerol-3-phosphate acyltransferase PlsY
MLPALLLLGSYLLGSVPFGLVFTRLARGVDVRQYGSHNVGAINVFRVGGTWLGLLTLLADAAKGAAAVLVAWALRQPDWLVAAAALAVMLGHAFSFWLFLRDRRFSEGKCVATSLGVLSGLAVSGALSWWVPAGLLAFWASGLVLPKLLTGRWWLISPITMTAAAGIAALILLDRAAPSYICLGVSMSLLILGRHKHNIERLLKGEEPRIGQKRPAERAGLAG